MVLDTRVFTSPPNLSSQILSDLIVWSKYSKFLPEKNRRETWHELVYRNREMHIKKYPQLFDEIVEAYKFVYDKQIMPSMRSMQFAGKPVELSPARLYNCSFMPIDHFLAFSELMFLLLSGCGVGYSVQTHHVEQLPEIKTPHRTRRYLIGDSVEGWADAVKALVRAYLDNKALPLFDYSDIRERGKRLKTAGGKAPGPEPLKACLESIRTIFQLKEDGDKLSTLDVHDICCHIANAVLSGGIRRSSMISLFDVDDDDMLNCKYGSWWEDNPQRALANNSAVIVRHKATRDVFDNIWERCQKSNAGEPGIFFTNDKNFGLNPCAEVSLRPFQFCNLTTINVSNVHSQNELNERAKAAAFIATLQAGYTDFHYLRDIWKRTTEKEALIGVSMTGIASNGVFYLDLSQAATVVKNENKRVAGLIGIKEAARTTVVKPEGTVSILLGTSSGIHAWHSEYYIRRIRVMKNEPIYSYLLRNHPELIEDEKFKPETQAVVSIPIKAPDGAITRNESSINLLERVSWVWNNWVKAGHRKGDNINNVSTTVSVRDGEWEDVGDWMWNHNNEFTALAVMPFDGGTYEQAPFEEIDEMTYNRMSAKLKPVDFGSIVEYEDNIVFEDTVACGGGACEIMSA